MLILYDGFTYPTVVYAVRSLERRHLSPMTHRLFDAGYFRNVVRVLVKSFGKARWINVRREDVHAYDDLVRNGVVHCRRDIVSSLGIIAKP